MIKEFVLEHFFLIVKLIIGAGVTFCILAAQTRRKNNSKISNDRVQDIYYTAKDSFTGSMGKSSKSSGFLMGVGVTVVVIGIVLFVLGTAALIFVIYILMQLKTLFMHLGMFR